MTNRHRLPLLVLAAAIGLLALTGCGGGSSYDPPPYGYVYVHNQTIYSTWEWIVFFEVAPLDGQWSGDLLYSDVPPGGSQYLGTLDEDRYDVYLEMESGAFVEWFDVFIGQGENFHFVAY